MKALEPEALAKRFHEAYERLAPSFGYETREASAKPWEDVPENNRRLMTAVCEEVLTSLEDVSVVVALARRAFERRIHGQNKRRVEMHKSRPERSDFFVDADFLAMKFAASDLGMEALVEEECIGCRAGKHLYGPGCQRIGMVLTDAEVAALFDETLPPGYIKILGRVVHVERLVRHRHELELTRRVLR